MFGCNVYSDGSAAAIDTWNPSSAKTNILDNTQVEMVYSFQANVDNALIDKGWILSTLGCN